MAVNLLSFASVMSTVGSVCLAILILLAMITVHEFGHYVAGKIFHFKINEFAIGFGPKLFSRTKKNGEVFSVRLLPLGGFCAFEGEDEENPHPDAFNNKRPWQRIIVLFAGAFMNYLLALLLIIISFFACGQLLLMTYRVDPADTTASGEYAINGLAFHDEDVIIKCEGKNIYLTTDLMSALEGRQEGEKVQFTVSRKTEEGRQVMDISVILRADADFENLTDTNTLWQCIGIYKQPLESGEGYQWQVYSMAYKGFGFFETIGRSFVYSFQIGGTIFKVLGQLLTGSLGLSAFGGPITTIRLTSEIASRGIQQFLEIAAYIGVNLAVFNLLPIPALDGSKIVFTAIEWIRGKPLNRKVEAVIHAAGFVLLIGFAILVDLLQLF
ncbi:MAG TPA: site-2 protease family protein [Candidatus Borkfalkia excrementigallinarum]|uniref:Site-2 protease family protein n=1 Tax=Candidatus Borkfalkia excrementigallinarum TaxID=2838506 RepID=A0A9D1ZV15_9FIRM|nr:site-2 protease family protein [Candidatus Borkfalkia excrementigallinarum]